MRNRDSLLGRARPADRLTREQIAALDQESSTPTGPGAHEGHTTAAGNGRTQANSG